jgi:hypothetical protein
LDNNDERYSFSLSARKPEFLYVKRTAGIEYLAGKPVAIFLTGDSEEDLS